MTSPSERQAGQQPGAARIPDAALLDALPHGVCIISSTGRIETANRTLAIRVRANADAFVGRPLTDLLKEEDRPRAARWMQREGAEGDARVLECVRLLDADGEPFFADLALGGTFGDDGARRLITITDVTEHREKELAQDARRRLLESHVERTPVAVIEWRLDRSVRYWNPSAERIFGYRFDEVESRDVFPLIVEQSSRKMVDEVWEKLVTNTGGEVCVNTNVTKDGRVIQCRWVSTTLTDDDGNVVGVASLAEDITERVEAQRQLSSAQLRLQRLVDELPVVIWAFDDNRVPVFWNAHAERVTGYGASEIIGNPNFLDLVHPRPEVKEAFLKTWEALDFGDFDEIELPTTCSDGTVRWIMLSNIAARCPIPGWGAWGIGIDVTDRHEAFEALRESERRYRDIIQNVDLAGIIVDRNGRVLFANEFFRDLSGWEAADIVGAEWSELFNPQGHERVETGDVLDPDRFRPRAEGTLRTRRGEVRTLVWTQSLLHNLGGEVVGVCALGMDVTDHRRAEAELQSHRDRLEQLVERRTIALAESQRKLQDSERLASMGRLAAGISHDLGNMLLPVRCHLDTLSRADLAPGTRSALDAVTTGVEFLEELSEGLSMLSAPDDPPVRRDRFCLEEWWNEIQPLLADLVPASITFRTRFDDGRREVSLPKHLLTRAIMNLLVNAVEALERHAPSNPTIEFRASSDHADGSLSLVFRDNGPGISEEVIRKAAEPFYTTKKRGLSTGLGLSVVDSFARMIGGEFRLESPESGGAVAALHLPAPASTPPPADSAQVGVDIEDPRISALCVELLRGMGCMMDDGKEQDHADFIVISREESERKGRRSSDDAAHTGPREIVVEPSRGMAGMRKTLFDALFPRNTT